MLAAKAEEEATAQKNLEKNTRSIQADDLVSFKQLLSRNELGGLEDVFESSLSQALSGSSQRTGLDLSVSKLNKVTQLTGFSDPVYAEAYVNVNQYDIVLDVLIVNQTADTLQNCTLELATLGDLKLVEKPSPIILAPHDFANIKASVKVKLIWKRNDFCASIRNVILFSCVLRLSGCFHREWNYLWQYRL